MFDSALLAKLQGDPELVALVSDFGGQPAIFSEAAPETAELPYVVFRIERSSTESPAVQKFNVYVDYFNRDTTAVQARAASERIEFVLDRAELEHERYSCIRLFFYSGGIVEDYEDPRAVHYNLLFEARAGRKKWIETKTGD